MVGKNFKVFMCCLVILFVLVGCTNKKEMKFVIGVTQIVAHPALDSTRHGFVDALKDQGFVENVNLEIIYKNAQDSIDNASLIANDFVTRDVDLIMAIATPSAQAAFNATEGTDIPLLFSAVTDPVVAGLVESNENTSGNVTGTSDMTPISKQLALLKELFPAAETVGIIYKTSEVNSEIQVNIARTEAAKLGLNVQVKGVTTATELGDALDLLLNDIDVLYVPTDNLVASSMPIVIEKTLAKGIPVIGSEEAHVKSGALATEGIDYYKLGYQTGLIAAEILNGKKPSDFPVETLKETSLVVNLTTAEALGITLSEEFKQKAKNVGE